MLRFSLKPLRMQVIVITGATSGNGLATVKQAAAAGARVVLAARDEAALAFVKKEVEASGGIAAYHVTDVGKEEDVKALARHAIDTFGGFDTWVNNAGVGLYGDALETSTAEHRRIFDTNYWGVVYGSLEAVRHFKEKKDGGALINVGSINSDLSSPVLSAYTASKHAVKGFTDSLRLEMIEQDAPVSVTLIKPSAIGTPFPRHGRNLTGFKAKLPPPIYAPETVARAILFAAQHSRRSITVGGVGKFQVLGATMLPRLFDQVASRMGAAFVDRSHPIGERPGNLFGSSSTKADVEGEQKGRPRSLFTTAQRHAGSIGALAMLSIAGAWLMRRRNRIGRPDEGHRSCLKEQGATR